MVSSDAVIRKPYTSVIQSAAVADAPRSGTIKASRGKAPSGPSLPRHTAPSVARAPTRAERAASLSRVGPLGEGERMVLMRDQPLPVRPAQAHGQAQPPIGVAC